MKPKNLIYPTRLHYMGSSIIKPNLNMSPESMSLSQIRPTEAKFLSSPGENENENKNKNIRENNFWSISDSYL